MKVGTYEDSTETSFACKAAPKKPTTHALLTEVLEAEKILDLDGMVRDAIKSTKILKLKYDSS